MPCSPQTGSRRTVIVSWPAYPYWHKSEFAKALWAAIMALHALDDDQTKVLILSAHGRRLTGTMLEAADLAIDLSEFAHMFGVLPANLVVYVSACWGGYPAALGVIQSGIRHPYVLGPLVDIHEGDADYMERELLDLLDAEPPSRRGLYKLVRFYNDWHEVRQDHYGSRRWLFGMADTSRHFFPRRAPGNQLGTSVADEEETFVVRRLLYANGSRVPVSCEVEDARGRYWQASIDPLLSLTAGSLAALGDLRFIALFQIASTLHLPDNAHAITLSGRRIIEFVEVRLA